MTLQNCRELVRVFRKFSHLAGGVGHTSEKKKRVANGTNRVTMQDDASWYTTN